MTSSVIRSLWSLRPRHLCHLQGFNCRYRALQPNGNAVIGSFGNTTENSQPGGNNFLQVMPVTVHIFLLLLVTVSIIHLQVVQCPSMGGSVAGTEDSTG